MSSANFVQSLIGKKNKKIAINDDQYLMKNEEWQDSVARVMLTGILKNQFYRSADESAKEALPLMVMAAKQDPAFLLKAACFARDSHMKGMVKLGLAALVGSADKRFLSRKQTKLAAIGLLASFHPGQLLQFVELCKSKALGRGFGSRAQKWVRSVMESWTLEKLEEYTLKYPSALNAIVRLVHPRYTDKRGGIVCYVLDDKKNKAVGKKQKAVESIKKPNVSSTKIAQEMLKHSVPWDVVKGFTGMQDVDVCMAMMTQMGLSALLLNMRSLEQHGVFNTANGLKALELKLNEVKNGRAIAIDFAKPYLYTNNTKAKGLLVNAMVDTLDVPMPYLEGLSVGVSIDISGSMRGEALLTAGLLAVPFLKAKNLWFTTFDTYLYEEGDKNNNRHYHNNSKHNCPVLNGRSKKQQVEALLNLQTAGGTDVSISLRKALETRKKLDLIIVITDEQQNSGTPLRKVWTEYKQRVNPSAELWVINATNYQWHSADFNDPSVVVYQTMTPAMFKNLKFVGTDLVSEIHNYDLNKVAEKASEMLEED